MKKDTHDHEFCDCIYKVPVFNSEGKLIGAETFIGEYCQSCGKAILKPNYNIYDLVKCEDECYRLRLKAEWAFVLNPKLINIPMFYVEDINKLDIIGMDSLINPE